MLEVSQNLLTAAASGFVRLVLRCWHRVLFLWACLTENNKPMIRPFQPFDTISTWRSAPDATGYIIRESPCTVPSSAVRLTADRDCTGVHGCGEGGKTGPGRPFCPVGRTLEPNVPDHRIRPVGALFLHRESCGGTGAGVATGTLVRRHLSPARGTVFGFRISGYEVGVLFAVRCTLFPESRNPAAARERGPLLKLLPGASRFCPGHGFRIPIRKTVFVPFYP